MIPVFKPAVGEEEWLAIRECLETGWMGLGPKTAAFEQAFGEFLGTEHVVGRNSCTAALDMAFKILGVTEGEVITTSLTFVSSNHAILYNNCTPVFADIRPDTLTLDPDDVRRKITPQTRAIMLVHYAGHPCEMDAFTALADEHGLYLIEDCAHAAGSTYNGKPVGTFGHAGCFSFHAVKNLPTADSGMVCFREEALDREARKWSWLGIDKDTYTRMYDTSAYKWMYGVEHVGFKYHGNSVMASLGLVSLRYVDRDNAYRRQLSDWYEQALSGCDEIGRIPVPHGCEPSRHLYQVLVPNRNEVMLALNRQEIYPGVHYRVNTDYPMYADQRGRCPNAERASESLISLPLHLGLSFQDVTRVARTLTEVLGSSTPPPGGRLAPHRREP